MLLMNAAIAEEAQRILESVDLSGVERLADEESVDLDLVLQALLAGDFESAINGIDWRAQLEAVLTGGARETLQSTVPLIALAFFLRLMIGEKAKTYAAARFVCRAGCVALLTKNFLRIAATAEETFALVNRCVQLITPALAAALLLTGAEGASAAVSPFAALSGNVIAGLFGTWGMLLARAAATLAAAGNLTPGITLRRLFKLIKQLVQWMTGALAAAFMGMTALAGKMTAARDGAAVRTAHFAIESVVPVVGGSVSESLDALLSTAAVVKNAIGGAGLLLLLNACLIPIARIGINVLLIRCLAAVSEPAQDKQLTAMSAQFADAGEMLLVLAIGAMLIAGTLLGGLIAVSGVRAG